MLYRSFTLVCIVLLLMGCGGAPRPESVIEEFNKTDSKVAFFTDNAVVTYAGRIYEGKDAIADWLKKRLRTGSSTISNMSSTNNTITWLENHHGEEANLTAIVQDGKITTLTIEPITFPTTALNMASIEYIENRSVPSLCGANTAYPPLPGLFTSDAAKRAASGACPQKAHFRVLRHLTEDEADLARLLRGEDAANLLNNGEKVDELQISFEIATAENQTWITVPALTHADPYFLYLIRKISETPAIPLVDLIPSDQKPQGFADLEVFENMPVDIAPGTTPACLGDYMLRNSGPGTLIIEPDTILAEIQPEGSTSVRQVTAAMVGTVLRPGAAIFLFRRASISSKGYTFTVRIDPNNIVTEADERNNTVTLRQAACVEVQR